MTGDASPRRGALRALIDRLVRRKATPRDRERIGVVIELASFDKGGLEKVVLDSALALDPQAFEVTIVAGTTGHLGRLAEAAGLRVVALPTKEPARAYDRLLRQIDPQVAISHFSNLGYPLFARRGIPNITFIHNVYAFLGPDVVATFKDDDRYVERYISVSKNATRYAVARLGVSEAKIRTIPNGLIIAEHERRSRTPGPLTRADLGLSPDDYVFANVASYNLHKGHYLMADAMRQVLKTRRDIKIVCVGNVIYEPHVQALKQYLEAEGLDGHLMMPGFFPDVADVHRIADAFLLPSFIEGWSIAMNEAMFHGKPMILTDTGASAEVIEDGDIGILVPNEYGDTTDLGSELLDELTYSPRAYKVAPQLAAAMIAMADDRDAWREKGKAGRRKILERFDFAQIVRRYEAVIRDVAASRAALSQRETR